MKLTETQKEFITMALAAFDRPSQVAKDFREEFGTAITRQHICNYDVEKRAGNVNRKLRELFWATREKYLKEVVTVPIALRAFRLRRMQIALDVAFDKGNYPFAMQIMEQAAKEVGSAFTNVQKHAHRHSVGEGGDDADFTADENRARFKSILAQALAMTEPKKDDTKH